MKVTNGLLGHYNGGLDRAKERRVSRQRTDCECCHALGNGKHGGNSEVCGRGTQGGVQGKTVALAGKAVWIKRQRLDAKQKSVEKLW